VGVRNALARLGLDPKRADVAADRWRPWRSYALMHLWTSSSVGDLRSSPKEK
jgi:AraC family transcriptional regulator of adaptative response / DNA-3-methyladenine glycosylase II